MPTMDTCKHVARVKPSSNHCILDPQKWHCGICGTTESVWACLGCSNVACGRYTDEHALKHYQETKHPLALEVNEKYVYCYECGDYVLNDNAAGDLKILRTCLTAVTTLTLPEVRGHHRLLRSHSYSGFDTRLQDRQMKDEDKCYTALWFRRYYLLGKVFSAWRMLTRAKSRERLQSSLHPIPEVPKKEETPLRKKRPMIPGVIGLRNLGNTCYMNSVLQVLSHLSGFREHLMHLQTRRDAPTPPPGRVTGRPSSPMSPQRQYMRQTTMECFQHVSDGSAKKGGLNGGSSQPWARAKQRMASTKDQTVSVCQELHALLRVMWSGKWALVSPHKMLYAIWHVSPFFKGYSQQDAQEFLCELLDKVQAELEVRDNDAVCTRPAQSSSGAPAAVPQLVASSFQGELISEVTCLNCSNSSHTCEPFMDLSLEFPDRYQARLKTHRVSAETCHVEEMLSKFTEVEKLDGKIYACEQCNKNRRKKAPVYTEAQKQLTINRLPQTLRLHLKRFMWCGRNDRGKISIHVNFAEELNMEPYCHTNNTEESFLYELSAVVMHHGKGFGSGHYTAYCYNREAESWTHCNDAKVELCSLSEVLGAQAYILFYTRKSPANIADPVPVRDSPFEEKADEEITFNFKNSQIPKFEDLKRRLSEEHAERPPLKRHKSTLW